MQSSNPQAQPYSGYFDNLFPKKGEETNFQVADSMQAADAIGNPSEQRYFQEEHPGHIGTRYPYDSYGRYYSSMYPGDIPHGDTHNPYMGLPFEGAMHPRHD